MALHLHPDCRLGSTPIPDLIPYLKDATGISPDDAGQMARGRLHAACLEHDLIRENHLGRFPAYLPTAMGCAVRSAALAPRRTAAEADRIFAGLLDRMGDLNRNGLIRVPSFWLYGSQMRRDRLIGDIDLVLDWERGPGVDIPTLESHLRAARDADGRPFRGGRDEAMEAFIRDRLIPEGLGSFISASFDDLEIRMLGIPCQHWTLEAGYAPGPILPHHPRADAPREAVGLTLITDRGPYRSRIPPDAELMADIRAAIRPWLGQGAGALVPGPVFGGVFRDVEMLTGRDPEHPLWQAVAGLVEQEARCQDVRLDAGLIDALAAERGHEPDDPERDLAAVCP
jgi:hypothetical protein